MTFLLLLKDTLYFFALPFHSSGYNIILAKKEINVEEEYYTYDFISFISECGGALGLFLGFSFFMIMDYVPPYQIVVKKFLNRF